MAEHYYTVGVHGPPTQETAPHGYGYRMNGSGWTTGHRDTVIWAKAAEWYPLPAPPTEEAPPPEPVARWSYGRDQVYSMRLKLNRIPPIVDHEEAVRYRDALNTLDATGIVWGEPRPMSELPDTGRVLAQCEDSFFTLYTETARGWGKGKPLDGWWPLPEVTP